MKRCKIPLSETHPVLLAEWDFEKNIINPEEITYGSGKKVWWVCKVCNYNWKASLDKRTRKSVPTGCPSCVGQVVTDKNNLGVKRPDLLDWWDYDKNRIKPNEVVCGSNKKIWWKCLKYKHSRKSSVKSRAGGIGCPVCAGKVSSKNNNLLKCSPDLMDEWDFDLNLKGPEAYTKCSGKKVWWVCKICDFSWKSSISGRVNGRGCPVHVGLVVTEYNSLKSLFPTLVDEEWDFEKNTIKPEEVTHGNHKKVWWIHTKDRPCGGHSWQAIIGNRTKKIKPRGCPACAGRVITKKNNLAARFNEVSKEWDYDYNDFGPEEVTPGSNIRVGWICNTGKSCGYRWRAQVGNRANGTGCPLCSISPVSRVSQRWLDSLNISQEFREFRIKIGSRFFMVDGFDPKTNTVYEFLGDYWHGNPEIYSADKINPTSKKSFGKLHQETVERIKILKENGYKVIYIWEREFIPKQGR